MPRVLCTTEVLRNAPGTHVDLLRATGFDLHFPSKIAILTERDVLDAAQGSIAIIAGSEPYTDRVLAELPELRIISRNGVGFDMIDIPAATRRGIAVTITPDGNHQAVAEHTLALMLAVARSVVSGAIDTRQGNWRRRNISIPLRGKTLGLVGLGRIGRSVAVRAAAFGMRLLAHESYPDHPLVALNNVIISPHLAALDAQAVEDMATGAARNIVDIFAGNWPTSGLLNPDVKEVWKA